MFSILAVRNDSMRMTDMVATARIKHFVKLTVYSRALSTAKRNILNFLMYVSCTAI